MQERKIEIQILNSAIDKSINDPNNENDEEFSSQVQVLKKLRAATPEDYQYVVTAFMYVKINKEKIKEKYTKYKTNPTAFSNLLMVGDKPYAPLHFDYHPSADVCWERLIGHLDDLEAAIIWAEKNNKLTELARTIGTGCCLESHLRGLKNFAVRHQGKVVPYFVDGLTKVVKQGLPVEKVCQECARFVGQLLVINDEVKPKNKNDKPEIIQNIYCLPVERLKKELIDLVIYDEDKINDWFEKNLTKLIYLKVFREHFLSQADESLQSKKLNKVLDSFKNNEENIQFLVKHLTSEEVDLALLGLAFAARWDLFALVLNNIPNPLLLAKKDDVTGETALHRLLTKITSTSDTQERNKLIELAKLLIEKGLDPLVENEDDLSSIAYAIHLNEQSIIEAILNKLSSKSNLNHKESKQKEGKEEKNVLKNKVANFDFDKIMAENIIALMIKGYMQPAINFLNTYPYLSLFAQCFLQADKKEYLDNFVVVAGGVFSVIDGEGNSIWHYLLKDPTIKYQKFLLWIQANPLIMSSWKNQTKNQNGKSPLVILLENHQGDSAEVIGFAKLLLPCDVLAAVLSLKNPKAKSWYEVFCKAKIIDAKKIYETIFTGPSDQEEKRIQLSEAILSHELCSEIAKEYVSNKTPALSFIAELLRLGANLNNVGPSPNFTKKLLLELYYEFSLAGLKDESLSVLEKMIRLNYADEVNEICFPSEVKSQSEAKESGFIASIRNYFFAKKQIKKEGSHLLQNNLYLLSLMAVNIASSADKLLNNLFRNYAKAIVSDNISLLDRAPLASAFQSGNSYFVKEYIKFFEFYGMELVDLILNYPSDHNWFSILKNEIGEAVLAKIMHDKNFKNREVITKYLAEMEDWEKLNNFLKQDGLEEKQEVKSRYPIVKFLLKAKDKNKANDYFKKLLEKDANFLEYCREQGALDAFVKTDNKLLAKTLVETDKDKKHTISLIGEILFCGRKCVDGSEIRADKVKEWLTYLFSDIAPNLFQFVIRSANQKKNEEADLVAISAAFQQEELYKNMLGQLCILFNDSIFEYLEFSYGLKAITAVVAIAKHMMKDSETSEKCLKYLVEREYWKAISLLIEETRSKTQERVIQVLEKELKNSFGEFPYHAILDKLIEAKQDTLPGFFDLRAKNSQGLNVFAYAILKNQHQIVIKAISILSHHPQEQLLEALLQLDSKSYSASIVEFFKTLSNSDKDKDDDLFGKITQIFLNLMKKDQDEIQKKTEKMFDLFVANFSPANAKLFIAYLVENAMENLLLKFLAIKDKTTKEDKEEKHSPVLKNNFPEIIFAVMLENYDEISDSIKEACARRLNSDHIVKTILEVKDKRQKKVLLLDFLPMLNNLSPESEVLIKAEKFSSKLLLWYLERLKPENAKLPPKLLPFFQKHQLRDFCFTDVKEIFIAVFNEQKLSITTGPINMFNNSNTLLTHLACLMSAIGQASSDEHMNVLFQDVLFAHKNKFSWTPKTLAALEECQQVWELYKKSKPDLKYRSG